MSVNRLVLYHDDTVFLHRFAAYLEKKSGRPVNCRLLQRAEEAEKVLLEGDVSLLILPEGSDFSCAEARQIPWLAFTPRSEGTHERQLPLYRPMDQQIRQIRRYITIGEEPRQAGEVCSMIGFYSPVHGAGQSVSAVLMGLFLAEEAPTLLLNLERFSGLKELAPVGCGGLSDLLYYSRVQGDVLDHLEECTEYMESLAYVPPAAEPEDLTEMKIPDWEMLLGKLRDSGRYRYLLLDMGDGIEKTEALLGWCDKIYVPLREDRLALMKLEEWKAYLAGKGAEEILKRLKPYRLPREAPEEWTEYKELKQMPWGRCLRALAEAE